MGSLEGRDSSHPAESLLLLLLKPQKQQRREKGRDHFLQEKFKLDHKKDFLCHEIQLCPEPTSSEGLVALGTDTAQGCSARKRRDLFCSTLITVSLHPEHAQ